MCLLFVIEITQSSCGPKLTKSSHESLCTLAKAPTNDAHCVAIMCGHAAGTQARNNTISHITVQVVVIEVHHLCIAVFAVLCLAG